MFYFSLVTSFSLGSIVGSFLNVVIDRADTKESPWRGRSHCPYCGTVLSWWELIPLLSFFWLKGKCSHCGHKISLQYPLVEALTGFSFAFAAWRLWRLPFFNVLFNLSLLEKILLGISFLFLLYWISILLVLAVYDFKRYLILTSVLFPALVITFVWRLFIGFMLAKNNFLILPHFYRYLGEKSYLFGFYSYWSSLIWGIVFAGGLISLLVVFTKEKAMGWGDAFLAPFLGMILGWPAVGLALVISFLSGGFISFILLIKKKKSLKSYLPFAPFLVVGTLTTIFFGDIIIKQYLSLI